MYNQNRRISSRTSWSASIRFMMTQITTPPGSPKISDPPKIPARKPNHTKLKKAIANAVTHPPDSSAETLSLQEESLRASEDKFRFMFEHSIVGKSFTLPSGEIHVNRAFCEMVGFSQEELRNKKWQEITYPDDIALTQRALSKILSGKQDTVRFTKRYIAKDGTVVWADVSTALLRDKNGEPLYFMTDASNITARMQAVETLRESEARFKTIFMTTLDAFFIATYAEGVFIECNNVFVEMFGYVKDEIVGRTARLLNLFCDLSDSTRLINELKANGLVRNLEVKGMKKNGEIIICSISTSIMQLNGKPHMVGLVRDITERKQAEKDLREREELFRSVFESAVAGISMVSADGKFIKVNNKLCEMLGFNQEELTGLHFDDITYEEDREVGIKFRKQVIAGELDNASFEKRYIKKDGNVIWVYISISAIRDLHKGFQYFITYIQDITDRKTAVEKLRLTIVGTVNTIALIVEARDPYTSGHQKRVAEISVAIAKELGLPEEQIQGIYFASLIHDLGKIQVPSEILSKTGKLTRIEYDMIKTHSKVGYELVKDIDFPWPIAEMVYQHHERVNGSGYPRRLKGNRISIGAKIIGMADVIEAISFHRPYRSALGLDAALEEIKLNKGILYDPDVVDAFLKVIRKDMTLIPLL
jgi:PAS domain S-box-containing protein/putative nucleotidyltransferase with HDIG domain